MRENATYFQREKIRENATSMRENTTYFQRKKNAKPERERDQKIKIKINIKIDHINLYEVGIRKYSIIIIASIASITNRL